MQTVLSRDPDIKGPPDASKRSILTSSQWILSGANVFPALTSNTKMLPSLVPTATCDPQIEIGLARECVEYQN